MFDHKHYVPILKTKAGERWAVGLLRPRTKSQITPLFEIHKHKKLDSAAHAEEVCEDLASIWGTNSPFFLDAIWLHDAVGDANILKAVFDAARKFGIQAIPVVRPSFSTSARAAVQRIVQKDGRGYLLRITRSDSNNAANTTATVSAIGIAYKSVHLMLDYRSSAMNLAADLPRVPSLAQWKTVTAASGVFPRSLTALTLNSWHQVARTDWQSWLQAVTSGTLQRRPAFADYTMRDPGPPADFGAPSVNLRYTKSPHWLVRVGGKVNMGASGQMHRLCQSLVARPDFDGGQFSAGDQAIVLTATGGPGTNGPGPGGPREWLQWCMNHHIEFTVHDIRNQPWL